MRPSIERSDEQGASRKNPQEYIPSEDATTPSIFLDPWLSVRGEPLAAIVDHLLAITAPDPASRIRSVRKDAAERKRFIVGNIVANLAHLALSPNREPGHLLAIATAHRQTKPTRYDRADYPQGLLAGTVAALEAAGMLVRYPYVFKQRTTTVGPTGGFTALLEQHGVRLSDIGMARQSGREERDNLDENLVSQR